MVKKKKSVPPKVEQQKVKSSGLDKERLEAGIILLIGLILLLQNFIPFAFLGAATQLIAAFLLVVMGMLKLLNISL